MDFEHLTFIFVDSFFNSFQNYKILFVFHEIINLFIVGEIKLKWIVNVESQKLLQKWYESWC